MERWSGEGDRDGGPGARLRDLPQIQRLLETDTAAGLTAAFSREETVAALRAVLQEARIALRAGAPASPSTEALLADARAWLQARAHAVLRPVINATGIVLHTNLGRAPLPAAALEAVAEAARGYSNLEFDLATGERGSRTQGVEPLLCELTGAEGALAVNNAAAAVLLALSGLSQGGEVIVSRGELVEIGGGFRIPEVIAQGGARLVEVGTTNRTRLADYAAAITPQTRVLLKVHQSNYRISGFTAEASLEELSGLARERGLVLMLDLGSGAMTDLARPGRPPEPTAADALAAGADIVAFSGDKLMGGPQAGLLVGRRAAIDPLRRHPLLRALRLDKMVLAALEATLKLYRDPGRAGREVPILRMLGQGQAALQARAERLAGLLAGLALEVRIEPSEGFAGGGSLPGSAVPSHAVSLDWDGGAQALAARLRAQRPAVVGRVSGGRLVLDMLTVADEEVADLARAIRSAADGAAGGVQET